MFAYDKTINNGGCPKGQIDKMRLLTEAVAMIDKIFWAGFFIGGIPFFVP